VDVVLVGDEAIEDGRRVGTAADTTLAGRPVGLELQAVLAVAVGDVADLTLMISR
jgi:hypothetical protein